jgi:hypothetical protein
VTATDRARSRVVCLIPLIRIAAWQLWPLTILDPTLRQTIALLRGPVLAWG